MPLPEKGEAGEGASGRQLEQLRGDWAEMRILQWFRGVCPRWFDVMLPNKVMVKGIRATESDLQICDALIGMDIITLGDMLITNAPNTRFEFRLPSKGAPSLK